MSETVHLRVEDEREALLSALAYGIEVCGLRYPNRQMATELARSNSGG